MKYKKFIFVFVLFFIPLLSGCGNNSVEIENNEFIKYETETIMPKIEYKVCSATECVTMYFLVVTNKAITGTESVELPQSCRQRNGMQKLHCIKYRKIKLIIYTTINTFRF